MAIIASSSLVESYQYILKQDEAVDKSDPDLDQKWAHYLDGTGAPPLRPGAEPTIWHLKPLSAAKKAKLSTFLGEDQNYATVMAAGYALIKVENLSDASGKAVRITHYDNKGIREVAEESMSQLMAIGGIGLIYELGARVIRQTFPELANPK